MNTNGSGKYAAALVALAICSACGVLRQAQDDVPVAPSTAALNGGYSGRTALVNGIPVTAAHPNLRVLPRYATIVPDRRAKSRFFEYIGNDYNSYTSIFDYPKSDQAIGTISGVGGQACTNVLYGYGKQTFWIVAGSTEINEYKILKKPIKTLSDSVGQPSSCAMDTSGDLAVGILAGSGTGDVLIFKNASGSPTIYTTPLIQEFYDGYDNRGNLFADGFNHSYKFELVELPSGSSTFQAITTSNTVLFPGSVQWDGTYLTVFDQETAALYQYTVSGTNATLKGTVPLRGSLDCAQTWIATGIVYCADAGNGDGEVFKYPAGGSILATLTGAFDLPLGVVAVKR